MRRTILTAFAGVALAFLAAGPAVADFISDCKEALSVDPKATEAVQNFLCQCYQSRAQASGDDKMESKLLFVLRKPPGSKARQQAAIDRPSTVPIFQACTRALQSG